MRAPARECEPLDIAVRVSEEVLAVDSVVCTHERRVPCGLRRPQHLDGAADERLHRLHRRERRRRRRALAAAAAAGAAIVAWVAAEPVEGIEGGVQPLRRRHVSERRVDRRLEWRERRGRRGLDGLALRHTKEFDEKGTARRRRRALAAARLAAAAAAAPLGER